MIGRIAGGLAFILLMGLVSAGLTLVAVYLSGAMARAGM